jgi:ATP-dependent DNA ligase
MAPQFPLPLDLAPMEARLVDELPEDPGWQFEPNGTGSAASRSAPEMR